MLPILICTCTILINTLLLCFAFHVGFHLVTIHISSIYLTLINTNQPFYLSVSIQLIYYLFIELLLEANLLALLVAFHAGMFDVACCLQI